MPAMVKGFQAISLCLCVLALAPLARADLSAADPTGFVAGPSTPPAPVAIGSGADRTLHLLTGPNLGSLRDVISSPPPSRRESAAITDGGASSMSLLLSALGSLGAWQLARSSRKVHLAHVPDWFHTGAPSRIGCCAVVDFSEAGLVPFTIDVYDAPPPAERLRWRPASDLPVFRKQYFLTAAGIRGPPPQFS